MLKLDLDKLRKGGYILFMTQRAKETIVDLGALVTIASILLMLYIL